MRIETSSHQGCVLLGLTGRLAIHPSLAQALGDAHTRPPRLRERLALGPMPTAAAAGRAFVREVCGRWGFQELAEPGASVASELVTNAVVHARTAPELRVDLVGRRLHVAVKDQDPNLPRLLAAKDGTERGRDLLVAEQTPAWRYARMGLGARSSGARWSCHHSKRPWWAPAGSRRP